MKLDREKRAAQLKLAQRVDLEDGSRWPDLNADEKAQAAAYRELLTHPWGANVSCNKIRMLRRALKTPRPSVLSAKAPTTELPQHLKETIMRQVLSMASMPEISRRRALAALSKEKK